MPHKHPSPYRKYVKILTVFFLTISKGSSIARSSTASVLKIRAAIAFAFLAIYLRKVFTDDPILSNTKIVISLYEEQFKTPLDSALAEKLHNEGIEDEGLTKIATPSYENLMRFVIDNADGVVVGSERANASLIDYARTQGKRVFEYQAPESEGFYDNYDKFYESLF